ncbi:MAG: transposase [Verrucomicrobiae bacterium]|nr:transposase [Verrucomicrobiae bacterium]
MEPAYYNPWNDIRFTQNRLPHWQQEGATYFVTWRLADSLPKEELERHFAERELWLNRHPPPWDDETEDRYHRLFSAKMDEWLDLGQGSCALRSPAVASHVVEALRHFEGDRVSIISFVVMPNHVHALFTLNPASKLESIIHSWKRQSAREINRAIGKTGPLWQKDYFDRLIRDRAHLSNCVRYIRRNPSKARLGPSESLLHESELASSIE